MWRSAFCPNPSPQGGQLRTYALYIPRASIKKWEYRQVILSPHDIGASKGAAQCPHVTRAFENVNVEALSVEVT